jgi:hypothetical protein
MVYGEGLNRTARRYPWPASRLGPEEMALLFLARQKAPCRTTITALLAQAVRLAFSGVEGGRQITDIKPKVAEVCRAAA